MTASPRQRLLLQYLEPAPVVDETDPQRLQDHLSGALDRLPVTDLALGWRLRPEVIDAIRSVIPDDVAVWRWVPVFVDSGTGRPADAHVAVGPSRRAPPPFGDMADFCFLCLDRDEVVEAGLERAVGLGQEIDAHGILLDRIRWHSPSQSPATELTCFCDHSRERAARDGLDLTRVAAELEGSVETLDGRRSMVTALLGRGGPGLVDDFLSWRSDTVTDVVARLSSGLRKAGLRSALDVFTPALTRSVGQDLRALAALGEWSKSMTYFDALGPASMPFELRGYATWLEEADDTDAAGFLADLLGFSAPGFGGRGPRLDALRREISRLSGSIGSDRSVVGVDAVEIAGVCEVDDSDLEARVGAIRDAGLGLSPCWELLFISGERIERLARVWDR